MFGRWHTLKVPAGKVVEKEDTHEEEEEVEDHKGEDSPSEQEEAGWSEKK